MDTNDSLTANQLKALDLLITEGKNQRETAEALKVTELTIHNWLNKPAYEAFQREHTARMDMAAEIGRRRLQSKINRAVDKLEEIAFGPWHSNLTGQANTRLKALGEIFDRAGLPKVTRQENTGANGGPQEHNVTLDDLDRRLSGRTPAGGAPPAPLYPDASTED